MELTRKAKDRGGVESFRGLLARHDEVIPFAVAAAGRVRDGAAAVHVGERVRVRPSPAEALAAVA